MMIIDDSNYRNFLNPIVAGQRRYTGYEGMWKPQTPPRSSGGFEELGIPMIPESEWADRARQREKDRTRLKDFALDMGCEVLDQGQTNYCWINAPVFCSMILRLQETGRVYRLSPASAGARIKNFRNVGGWGSEGLDFLIDNGCNEQDDWPANAINRSYSNVENHEKAKQHQVREYFKLTSGRAGWPEVVSCILAGIPVAVGYNWWGHEVTGTDLTTGLDLGIANSWSVSWGENGYGTLKGNKKYPDDAVAITALNPL